MIYIDIVLEYILHAILVRYHLQAGVLGELLKVRFISLTGW